MARTIQPTREQIAIDQRAQDALAQFERDRKRYPDYPEQDLWDDGPYDEPLRAYAQMVAEADVCRIPSCWTERDHRIKCDTHLDATSPI
ncbi:MAG: hypothetical protein ACRD0P_19500 [Stackebrandtia sp.]